MQLNFKEAVMEKVKYEQTGALGIITFIDPPLNLLGEDLRQGFSRAVEQAGRGNLRGLLLKNDEGNFSAGADVNLFIGLTPEKARERFAGFHAILHAIEAFPFPTMAAVRGLCLAGGLEIALAFDLIWASQNAAFGQVEVVIGALPFGGGAQRLASRAGANRARELVFGGRIYPAADFERWNIINRILPEADLSAKALAYMQNLAENGATVAIGYSKQIINTYVGKGLAQADSLTLELAAELFKTEDLQLGPQSLLKNGPGKAKFSGR
jgi:enoyl-CoA hydratase/carnithine racemase